MHEFRVKQIILVLLLLVMTGSGSRAANGPPYVQDLSVRLQPAENSLRATAVLSLDESWDTPPDIRLGRGVRIHSLRINGTETGFTFNNGAIRFDPVAGRIAPREIKIEYSAIFSDAPPRRPVHDEDPSYGVTAAITPQGTFLGAGAGWHPAIPGHAADFRVHVEAPAGISAVTGGRRVALRTENAMTVSEWRTYSASGRLALAAGDFVVGEAAAGDIPVYTFFSRENAGLQQIYLDRSVDYIRLYEKMFGSYPFAKFAVVENFFPTGYGFPSWTLIGGTVLRLPFITETSLGHEIAHSWWGNGVHVDYASGNWSEGLTTYVADHLYKERESAEAARKYRLKILRDYAVLAAGGNGYPVSEFRSRQSAVDQAVGYGKVAMIFHMLRIRLGDDVFLAGLRHLAETRMGLTTTWQDIRTSFTAVSGRDLSAFFDQWLSRERGPKLSLADVECIRKENSWTVTGAIVQEPPYYDLEVPIGLSTPEGTTIAVHSLTGAKKDFEIIVNSAPQSLQLDPQVRLFRELHPQEVPPLVNTIRGSGDLLVVAADSLPPSVRDEALQLVAAFRHEVSAIPESKLTPEMIEGRDLLFLGWPQRFVPTLPAGIEVDGHGFRYGEKGYSESGDALFAAFEHPLDESRAAAVYLPMSAKAAESINRKIPHYGKYSILVFRDGKNVVKDTWPTKPGPTLHIFDKESTHADR